MAKKKEKHTFVRNPKAARPHRLVALMSDEELQMVDHYLNKYHISNRSRWMRETLLKHILHNLEIDYPTLFDEHDMRR
ncbi:MAG: hypothetical protein J6Y84_05030 [Bacteroidaceae bacterium]|nr:hypothetical protein [Bacteroidaceae bacterium]